MPNPYFQVARTYLERPISSLQGPLPFFTFLIWFITFIGLIAAGKLIPSQLFLYIILFLYWAIHVKEQFADSRASLTPGFRKIHGTVAVTAGMVFVILLPGVTALLIGRQPIGLISITMFLFGLILWAILRLGDTFTSLIWVGWIFTIIDPKNSIEKIILGNEPVQAFIIMSIGVILSITGIIRLFLLNEEKPGYYLRSLKFNAEGRTKLSDLQWQKLNKSYSGRWRKWLSDRMVIRMIYHARHAADSYWSRMQRWSHSRSIWHIIFHATYINLFLILIYSLSKGTFLPGIRIVLATFMPIFIVHKQFKEKSSFMAQDLMMPVRRNAYLKQVGISFATRLFIEWGVFMTVTVLLMLPSVLKPTSEFLIISISYSLMIQIWLFGVNIWISSFNSNSMNFWGIPAILLLWISFMIAFNPQQIITPRWPLILGAILACHGLLLTWRGYRRWMVVDFD